MAAEHESTTYTLHQSNLFRAVPTERLEEYGALVAEDWLYGYMQEISGQQGVQSAQEYAGFLERLGQHDTMDHQALIGGTAARIDQGDVVALTIGEVSGSVKLRGFARGWLYRPGVPKVLQRLRPEYVYVPDALGDSPETMDTAIRGVVSSLFADGKRVVVDALQNNTESQRALKEIGFVATRTQIWQTSSLFERFVGPAQAVVQFERRSVNH